MENDLHKIWAEEMRVEPLLETDAGVIYIQPSDDGTKLEYGTVSNIGLLVTGDMEYDFDFSLDENIQALADIIYEEYGYPDFNESKKYLQIEKVKDNATYVNRPELNGRKQLCVSLFEDNELKDTFGITDTNVSDDEIRKLAKKHFNNISDDIKIVRNESLKRRNEEFYDESKFEESAKHMADWLKGDYINKNDVFIVTGKFYNQDIKLTISKKEMSIEFPLQKEKIDLPQIDVINHDAFVICAIFKKEIKKAYKGLNESLKRRNEEYGSYRYELDDAANDLERGYTSGSGSNEYGDYTWYLTVNGEKLEDLLKTPEIRDWVCYEISYPVKDGHACYIDLDTIFNNWSYTEQIDHTDEDVIQDLITLGFDEDSVRELAEKGNATDGNTDGGMIEIETWIDYDIHYDLEENENDFDESLKRRNEAFIVGNSIFISDLEYTINYGSGNKYFNSASYIPVKGIGQFTLETIKDTIIKKMRELGFDKKYTFNKDDLKYDEATGIIELDNAPLLNTEYVPEPAKDGTIKLTCKLWVHPKDSNIK